MCQVDEDAEPVAFRNHCAAEIREAAAVLRPLGLEIAERVSM